MKKVPLGCLSLLRSESYVSFIEEIMARQDTEIDCRKIIAGVEIADSQENAAFGIRSFGGWFLSAAAEVCGYFVFFENVIHPLGAPEIGDYESYVFPGVAEFLQVADQLADVAVIFPRGLRRQIDQELSPHLQR